MRFPCSTIFQSLSLSVLLSLFLTLSLWLTGWLKRPRRCVLLLLASWNISLSLFLPFCPLKAQLLFKLSWQMASYIVLDCLFNKLKTMGVFLANCYAPISHFQHLPASFILEKTKKRPLLFSGKCLCTALESRHLFFFFSALPNYKNIFHAILLL